MRQPFRIIHYLNQFFSGIGGEEKATIEPSCIEGVVGPGIALQKMFEEKGDIVATVYCGDNYFSEKTQEATQKVIDLINPYHPNLFIAGPAFNAGRYGVACGTICKAVQEVLGIPTVTGMHEDNPGVDMFREYIYIIRTSDTVMGMREALSKIASLSYKFVNNKRIGGPDEERYFSRGKLIYFLSDKTGAERVVDMLLDKLDGKKFKAELHPPKYDHVEPAPPIKSLSLAKIALVTDGGLVPRGNPDMLELVHATKYGSYNIENNDRLFAEDYEVVHAGYDNKWVNLDPNRLVPVDVMKDIEREEIIGKLNEYFLSTTGVGTSIGNSIKISKGMLEQIKSDGVDGVILTST